MTLKPSKSLQQNHFITPSYNFNFLLLYKYELKTRSMDENTFSNNYHTRELISVAYIHAIGTHVCFGNEDIFAYEKHEIPLNCGGNKTFNPLFLPPPRAPRPF